MLLSLRGWGAEEFRYAAGDFIDAARWAIYAEKVAPKLAHLEEALAVSLPAEPRAKAEAARQKLAASRDLPLWREALLLDGEE